MTTPVYCGRQWGCVRPVAASAHEVQRRVLNDGEWYPWLLVLGPTAKLKQFTNVTNAAAARYYLDMLTRAGYVKDADMAYSEIYTDPPDHRKRYIDVQVWRQP